MIERWCKTVKEGEKERESERDRKVEDRQTGRVETRRKRHCDRKDFADQAGALNM